MNFLLHRHLAHQATQSPLAGVGAMLPDLWRMVDRRARTAPSHVAWQALERSSAAARELMRGVDHHLEADLWFHAADVFTLGERATIDALRGAATTVKKLTLFAHPLWEMCLDGALVRRLGAGAVRSTTAEGFRAAGDATRDAATACCFGHTDEPEERAAALDARVRHVTDELSNGPWIEAYATPHGLARALTGMRRRFGLAPLEGAERDAIARAIATLDARADAALDEILGYRPDDRPRAHRDQALSERGGAAGIK